MPRGSSDYKVVFNDLDRHVSNFFRVLRDSTEEFLNKLYATPYSREEFEKAFEAIHTGGYKCVDSIEWARLYLISNRQSFAGKEDRTWCVSRNGENICVSWHQLPPLVKSVAEHLKHAFIENSDYKDVFRRWDDEKTCFYIDPPYEKVEADYYHVNKEGGFDHKELAECVKKLKGSAVISYYDSDAIRSLYDGYRFETQVVQKRMQTRETKDRATELLIIKTSDWAKSKDSIL